MTFAKKVTGVLAKVTLVLPGVPEFTRRFRLNRGFLTPQMVFLANEQPIGHAIDLILGQGLEELHLPNISQGDFNHGEHQSVVRIPYGEFMNGKYLQVIDRKAGEAIAKYFANHQIDRGLPVYIGHPDHKDFRDQHTDGSSYGWVVNIEPADEGLDLTVDWNEAGVYLYKQKRFKSASPNMRFNLLRAMLSGNRISPSRIKSLGLTNNPNIPGTDLGNEAMDDEAISNQPNPQEGNKFMEREELITLLELANEATDQEITDALGKLVENGKALELANEKIETLGKDHAKLTIVSDQLDAANTKLDGVTKELELANEKSANLILDAAIEDGKITPANKPAWLDRFKTDPAAAEVELANEKIPLPTKSKTADLDLGGKANAHNKQSQILELANERMEDKGCDWDTAYRWLKKKQPALFEK